MADEQMMAWVTRVLGFTFVPPGEGGQVPPGVVAFAKMRLAWNAAKNQVAADLSQLRKTVLAEFGDDPVSRSLARLDEVLGHFQAGLGDQLDDLANAATPDARRKTARASETIAADYLAYVEGDPLIDFVETNPFEPIVISGRLAAPLRQIHGALAAIAG